MSKKFPRGVKLPPPQARGAAMLPGGNLGANRPELPTFQVDINECPDIRCDNCDGLYFDRTCRLKKISQLISPTGHEEPVMVNVLVCRACGVERSTGRVVK